MPPTAPTPQISAAQKAQLAKQQNLQARQMVVQQSVDMTQLIATQTVFPASNPIFNTPPRNVGLIKRFTVEIVFTITNSGTTTISLTDFGLANVLTNVQYTNINNYLCINTDGRHLTMVSNAKRKRPYGAAFQVNTALANNLSQMLNVAPASWPVFVAPATIASGASGTCRAVFEVPLAYSNSDLRGAIFSNTINATQNLQLTLNQNPVAAGTADTTSAIYAGATGSAGSITTSTINVYQEYLYQLPTTQSGSYVLPLQDLATVYELKFSLFPSITANQPFNLPYSNFRDFVSTFVIFNNNGLASGRTFGTDVTNWGLQAASSQYLWQIDPLLATQRSREHLMADIPAGTYYFPSRDKPIATTQYGNMQLVLFANTSTPSGYCLQYVEDLGLLNALAGASSLAS